MGVRARRALWRLARPFARPGPRWRRVAAGFRRRAPIAVGRAGSYALVQAKDGAQICLRVEARDEVSLGCTGVSEADLDIGVHERPNDALGTVHHPPATLIFLKHLSFLPTTI